MLGTNLSKSIKKGPHFARSMKLSPHCLIGSFLWYIPGPQFPCWKNEDGNGGCGIKWRHRWEAFSSVSGPLQAELLHLSPSLHKCSFGPCLPSCIPSLHLHCAPGTMLGTVIRGGPLSTIGLALSLATNTGSLSDVGNQPWPRQIPWPLEGEGCFLPPNCLP